MSDPVALVGELPHETRFLQLQRCQRSIEELIASCLTPFGEPLLDVYHHLRIIDGPQQLQVVTQPSFGALTAATLRAASAGQSAKEFAAPLRALLLDAQPSAADAWLEFDGQKLIALPFSGYMLKASAALHEVHVAKDDDGYRLTALGRTLHADLAEGQFRSVSLPGRNWIDIWRLPRSGATVDPLTTVYRTGIEPGWSVEPPSRQMFQRWGGVLREAAELLECIEPTVLNDVRLLAPVVVPVANSSRGKHLSSSSPSLPDVVYMSWTERVLQIVEAWVHEAGHQKLFLAEALSPLVTSTEPVFASPWRPDPRPARGLLHGAFAFGGVVCVWARLLECGRCPTAFHEKVRESIVRLRGEVDDALRKIRGARVLTEAGENVAEQIVRSLNAWPLRTPLFRAAASERSAETAISPERTLEAILDGQPWALALTQELRLIVKTLMVAAKWPDPLRESVAAATDAYILRQCLPLAEASVGFHQTELLRLLELHLQCGIVWRCVDSAADHAVDIDERLSLEDAVLVSLDGISRTLASMNRRLDRRTRSLLMEFRRYADVEASGVLSPRDIWRRASPFLVVPSMLFSRCANYQRPFRNYLILLGLLDDLVDGWDDLLTQRRTWVTECLRENRPNKVAGLFISTCDECAESILKKLPKHVPLWRQLVEQARTESHDVVRLLYNTDVSRSNVC